jgi:F0F1-type ATP synthase delta subunit
MHETYAQALWQMIERGTKPKDAIAKLRANLALQAREALLPKIAKAFVRIAQRFEAQNGLVLTVAREKDERAALREAKQLLSEMDVESKGVTTSVDDSIIGGWRLEGRGLLLDASFKKYLLSLYNRATQS